MFKNKVKFHPSLRKINLLLLVVSFFQFSFGQFDLPDVSNLDTYEKKEHFLLALFKLDQHFRMEEMELAFSGDSIKKMENIKNWIKADSICREQTAQYITLYGYPSGESLTPVAKSAPLTVILHMPADMNQFFMYFDELNQAYKNQFLSESDFDFYLCKALFEIKHLDYIQCGELKMDNKIQQVKKISADFINK